MTPASACPDGGSGAAPGAEGVLDRVRVGVVACDAAGRLTVVNRVVREMHGLSEDEAFHPERWFARAQVHEADGTTPLTEDRAPLLRVLAGDLAQGEDADVVVVTADGRSRRLRCSGHLVEADDGALLGAVMTLLDVTAEHAAEQELQRAHAELTRSARALARSEEQFRSAFEHGPTPMCRLDARGLVRSANPAMRRLLATSSRRLLGRPLVAAVLPADRERLDVALSAAGSPHLPVEPVEVRVVRGDGSALWCEASAAGGEDDDGAYVLVQLADVDERRAREERLERLASSDPLTGVLNRAALTRLLAERLAPGACGAVDGAPELSLLFLDLDGFKAVNDTYGHAAGDLVLVEVAARLRAAVRPEDVVARLGGDEFVVVRAPAEADPEQAAQALARRLRDVVAAPVDLAGCTGTDGGPAGAVRVGVTVGVAHAVPGEQPAAVLARADRAMYEGKDALARAGAPHALVPQTRLAELVDTAAGEGRLLVAYQPVVDLRSGRTVGAEALVRMLDRAGEVVVPDAFIPLAEASGAIHEIGEHVLRTACTQAAAWKRLLPGVADFAIGVNLSPRQLDDPGLHARVDAALAASGLPPDALVLELTERLLTADTGTVQHQLQGLRDRGVHLAADDFGTGYCALRYLVDLPLDVVKVDRSWTSRLSDPGPRGRLAAGVFRLADTTGMPVIVEGVETEQERDLALAHGMVLGQGYLFSRPVPAEDFEGLLLSQAAALL